MKHIKKYNEHKSRDTIDLSIIEDYLLKIRDRGFPIEFEADYVDHLYITIEFSEERRNENFYKSIDEFVEENKNIEFISGELEIFDRRIKDSQYKNYVEYIIYATESEENLDNSRIIIHIKFTKSMDFIESDKKKPDYM